MTIKNKPFPIQWLVVGLSFFLASAGAITAFAVQGEKVKQLEAKTITIITETKENDKANTQEHKAIMAVLTRIETKLEYIPTVGYGRRYPMLDTGR